MAAALITALVLWGYLAYERRQQFRDDSAASRLAFVEQKRKEVRREVTGAVDFAEFTRDRVEDRVRETLRRRVDQAHAVATQLLQIYGGTLSPGEMESLLRETLRPLRFDRGRGYLFAVDLGGKVMLNAARPELEGRDFIAALDSEGMPFIRAMVDTVRRDGEGFVTYSWPKPGRPGESFPKESFVRLLEPAGWIIGTGEYQEDMEQAIQSEVLERIRQLQFGEDGYIFVFDYDSTMRVHRARPVLEGHRLLESPDPLLRGLFPRMMEASSRDGGGYVQYVWPKADGSDSTKVTYVTRVPEWRWVLGAGFHLDDLEAGIAAEQEELRSQLVGQLADVGWVAILVMLGILALNRLLARRLQRNLTTFHQFFADAARLHTRIDETSVGFSEFDSLARAANQMVDERREVEEEKQKLEGELLQRRKLEAIGHLAGGIAHDFNNILSAINGYAELGMAETDGQGKLHGRFARILRAGERARDLVRQILTFSRQDQQERRPVEMRPLVEEVLGLLRASTPATVEIRTELRSAAWVEADPAQLHQLLLNLGTNAVSAMTAGGGVLTVELVDEDPHPGGEPGAPRLCVVVRDTGVGMSGELKEHIFDPFFTTRGPGEGTGMGLAVVHGIVESCGGSIEVESAPARGSTFRVWLPTVPPAAAGVAPADQAAAAPGVPPPGGREHVLLVDDERFQTELVEELLARLGYRVTALNAPRDALERFAAAPEAFDLVISDVTMPRMPGDVLAQELRRVRPDVPILLCTGHNERLAEMGAADLGVSAVLLKPLSMPQLAAAVRGALDG